MYDYTDFRLWMHSMITCELTIVLKVQLLKRQLFQPQTRLVKKKTISFIIGCINVLISTKMAHVTGIVFGLIKMKLPKRLSKII